MPLLVTQESSAALAESLVSTATASQPSFLVVYASLTNGKSWCGDCRRAEPLVEKFLGAGSEDVRVVYAGQPAEWRNPDNVWRQEPFLVEKLPTLIKVTGSGKWLRLVEGDVYDEKKLKHFIEK